MFRKTRRTWGAATKMRFIESERAAELYVDELVDGSGEPLSHDCERGLTRLVIPVSVDRYLSMSALAEAEAADRFYGVQMEMFSEGDLHGS